MNPHKKNPAARYTTAGLILSGLGCVVSALIGAAKGLIAAEMFPDIGDISGLNLGLQISLGVMVIGLALYAILAPDAIRRFLSGRQVRYGSNSVILSLAFVGIIVVVNTIAFQNPKSWDMTEDKSNTLAPQTLQTLASLPDTVVATAFYSMNLDSTGADELLLKFKNSSAGKFDYRFVDPDLDPVAARQAGVTGDGKILLQMGETKEIASYADEQELTRTMIRLISPEKRAVYFLEGHGEATLDGSTEMDLSRAKSTLESKNYTVNSLNLFTSPGIPADALAVIVAGPMKPLSEGEVQQLKEYVAGGGSLIVMENPIALTDFGGAADPLAEYLSSDWGIILNDDIVIDLINSQNPLQAVSSNIGMHPITQNLTQNYVVVLPQARSLSMGAEKENVTLTPIILTTEKSWGESEFTSIDQIQFDEGKDIPGPLNLIISGENSATGGRVVVAGNSLFATNSSFDVYGNGNMFINSVDWAAEQENLLNLTPREPITRTFTAPNNITFVVMIITTVLVLPGLVVFLGISAWAARRKRG